MTQEQTPETRCVTCGEYEYNYNAPSAPHGEIYGHPFAPSLTADVQEAPDDGFAWADHNRRVVEYWQTCQEHGPLSAAAREAASAVSEARKVVAAAVRGEAEARIADLEAALLEYGGHLGYCMSATTHGGERECICGFSALLAAPDALLEVKDAR